MSKDIDESFLEELDEADFEKAVLEYLESEPIEDLEEEEDPA